MPRIVVNKDTARKIVDLGSKSKKVNVHHTRFNSRKKVYKQNQDVEYEEDNQDIKIAKIYRNMNGVFPYSLENFTVFDDIDIKIQDGSTRHTTHWIYDEETGLYKCHGYLMDQYGINDTGTKIDIYTFICVEPIYDTNDGYNTKGAISGWAWDSSRTFADGFGASGIVARDYFYYEHVKTYTNLNIGLNQLTTQRFFVYQEDDRWNLLVRMDWLHLATRRLYNNGYTYDLTTKLSESAYKSARGQL